MLDFVVRFFFPFVDLSSRPLGMEFYVASKNVAGRRWCKARRMTAVVQSLLPKGKERRPCRLALLSAALGPHGKSGKLCQAYLPSAARRIPLLRKMLFREVEVRFIGRSSIPLGRGTFTEGKRIKGRQVFSCGPSLVLMNTQRHLLLRNALPLRTMIPL